jgi:hypothetical protein
VTKNGLGYILGDFFTNSPGRPAAVANEYGFISAVTLTGNLFSSFFVDFHIQFHH